MFFNYNFDRYHKNELKLYKFNILKFYRFKKLQNFINISRNLNLKFNLILIRYTVWYKFSSSLKYFRKIIINYS